MKNTLLYLITLRNKCKERRGRYVTFTTLHQAEHQLTMGKRAERTQRDFQWAISCSAIGQASCLIWARRRQLTFPFCY